MIPLSVWYAHHGGAPIPKRARPPRVEPRFEWRVAGEVTSRHGTLKGALLHKDRPAEAALYVRTPTGSVPWAEYRARCQEQKDK